VQNLVKYGEDFKEFCQFYKQYILFVMRLTTSEKRNVSYIFAKYDQFMPKLFPKMHFS